MLLLCRICWYHSAFALSFILLHKPTLHYFAKSNHKRNHTLNAPTHPYTFNESPFRRPNVLSIFTTQAQAVRHLCLPFLLWRSKNKQFEWISQGMNSHLSALRSYWISSAAFQINYGLEHKFRNLHSTIKEKCVLMWQHPYEQVTALCYFSSSSFSVAFHSFSTIHSLLHPHGHGGTNTSEDIT